MGFRYVFHNIYATFYFGSILLIAWEVFENGVVGGIVTYECSGSMLIDIIFGEVGLILFYAVLFYTSHSNANTNAR